MRYKIENNNVVKTITMLYELTGNIALIEDTTGISKMIIYRVLNEQKKKKEIKLLFGRRICYRTIENLRIIDDVKRNQNLDKYKGEKSIPHLIYHTKRYMLDYFNVTVGKNKKRTNYMSSMDYIEKVDNKEISITEIAAIENVSIPAISRKLKRHREKIKKEAEKLDKTLVECCACKSLVDVDSIHDFYSSSDYIVCINCGEEKINE